MLAGKVWSGKIRFFLDMNVTMLTASGGAGVGGEYSMYGRTWQIGFFGVLQDGITMNIQSAKNIAGVDSYEYGLEIGELAISQTLSGAAWKPAVRSQVTIPLDVYQDYRGWWYVEYGTVDWTVDGVTNTYSPINRLHSGLTPQFLKALGTPFMVHPDIAPVPQNPYTSCDAYTIGGTMMATALGGYEIWDNEAPVPAWESLPIYWPTPVVPAAPGAPFGLDLAGITTGTTTADCGLNLYSTGRSINSRYRTTNFINGDGEQKIGWFGVVPDLARRITRATQDNYRALWVRGGFPEVRDFGSHVYGDTSSRDIRTMTGLSNGSSQIATLVSPLGADLQTVGKDIARIDGPLDVLHVPMIVTIAHGKSVAHGPGIAEGGVCTDNGIDPPAYESNVGESIGYQSVFQVDAYSGGSGMLEYLQQGIVSTANVNAAAFGDYDGKDAIARYWSYWCHPHWSYLYQPRDTVVDGSSVAWKDYIYPLGQQYLDHPSLPSGDRRKTRTDLISMTGREGPNSAPGNYIANFITGDPDIPTSWVGNYRFVVDGWALPASLTLTSASSARWEIKDGGGSTLTGTFAGSDVSVPPGAGDVIAKIELASFSAEGYMYPSIAQRFEVLRDSATVDRIRVYLVGADGEEVELNETDVQTAGGANWPATGRTAAKYAGTWGQDYGLGVVSDTGVDILAAGESSTVTADPVRSCVFQLLPGRTAKYLKIVATPKPATSPIKLKYPKFYAPTTTPQIHYHGRQLCSVVWPNGPGIVLGSWDFWDYLLDSFTATPLVYAIGSKSSVLDALCTRNLFEGKVATDGLDARIASLYVSGVEYGPGAERRSAAYDTIAWWVISEDNVAACLQNTYVPPPTAYFPPRVRDDDFLEAADRTLETVDWTQEPREIIVPSGDALGEFLLSPLAEWTSPMSGVASGWDGRSHTHIVLNDEDPDDYRLKGIVDLVSYAKRRPWHGAFAVLGIAGPEEDDDWVSNCFSDLGHYHETTERDGSIYYRRCDGPIPRSFTIDVQVTSTGSDHRPRCAVSASGMAVLVFDRDGTGSMRTVSHDDGFTWETPATIAAMGKYPITWFDEIGYEGYAWFEYNSGSSGPGRVKLKTRGPGESSFSSTITIAVDVEDAGFGITAPPSFQNVWVLAAIKSGGSAPTRFLSFDQGETWEEV